jgi:hypothetical protein
MLGDLKSTSKEMRDAAQKKFDELQKEILGLTLIGEGPPPLEPSQLERFLEFPVKDKDGKVLSMEETPFSGRDDGNMARAFFDKETVYKNKKNNLPPEEMDKFHAQRDGERKALIAWAQAPDPARQAAYEADKFALPKELADKPITQDYAKEGKLLVKTLITERCARCHMPGAKGEEWPLTNYKEIRKYLNPPLPPEK